MFNESQHDKFEHDEHMRAVDIWWVDGRRVCYLYTGPGGLGPGIYTYRMVDLTPSGKVKLAYDSYEA